MKKLLIVLLVIVILGGLAWSYFNQNYATPILMYHSLNKARIETYAALDPIVFRRQMELIKSGGYKVISLSQYCRLVKSAKPIPRKLVVITFDDGHKDNLKAIEILKEFNYPATIFIIAESVGGKGYLSKEDIALVLSDTKVNIGSHTLTHAYLPDQGKERVRKEIFQSKKRLEQMFPQSIETISYPVGGFNEETLKDVEAVGYLCACATNRGFSKKLNLFALRRIKVTNRDFGFRFWAKLSGFYNAFRKPKYPY